MINQVTIVGRLTRDPELKFTAEGIPVTNVTVALDRHYRNQYGEIDTDFVLCTLWKRIAENTAQYCRKGSIVGITGRIQTRNYENDEGIKVYVTEVVAESVKFMGRKKTEEEMNKEKQEVHTIG
ncbi:single-stranded DNA-binding protein [Bacillus aquiflavi]|uniref:Single-stranded DNA-binding protein n=1 Tax=Bacillus aquiflavi TaxID=2672567 RepID=A0A6B3VUV4_9BACI|nr:single-stranded DNA-binding protein [Bacillus aquiflavi]MBA4536670.1 single-stranded DNA-binding protein [Bacillus aquiflavi]NEY81038.1 single-stranded DNA-binding protein [Bacillus aquiflavi]UAC47891.1 single-stranded DNA-binding protein [Bacillus aquiflavi]